MKVPPFVAACLLSLYVASAAGSAHAAPKSEPRKSPAELERQAQAEAEFKTALAALTAWCESINREHERAPRDAQLVLRVAHCRRILGESDQAEALLFEAKATLGPAPLEQAQAVVDAEIGRAANTGPNGAPAPTLWDQACEHFEASLRLDASITVQLAMSECYMRRGQFQLARKMIDDAIAAVTPQAESDAFRARQLALAHVLEHELERLQPRVVVAAHAGFRGKVHLGDTTAKLSEPTLLEPGRVDLRAELSNGAVRTASLQLAPTETVRVTIGEPSRAYSSGRRILVWSLLGTGAAAAVTSTVMFVSAQDRWGELSKLGCERSTIFGGGVSCPSSVNESLGSSYNNRINLFQATAIGALLLGSGALIVHLTTPKQERLRIAPSVQGRGAAGISASLRF